LGKHDQLDGAYPRMEYSITTGEKGESAMKKRLKAISLLFFLFVASSVAFAAITPGDYLGSYGLVWKLVWDGWEGELVLRPTPWTANSKLSKGGAVYKVRYELVRNPQENIDGMMGPGYLGASSRLGHRIVFWVDFPGTPTNLLDDQRFDGYMMTQTEKAFAGVTWSNRIPYGFYATFRYGVPG